MIAVAYAAVGVIVAAVAYAAEGDDTFLGVAPLIVMVWPLFVVFGSVFWVVRFLGEWIRERSWYERS